jgi:23S rRNA (cytidine1920-2'-O)/16S rRNA (cytidine1409-2'-O)-methyltransferase
MSSLERIDKALVTLNLCETRSQATGLIKEGFVYYNGGQVTKTSLKISLDEPERIDIRKDYQFVGRGAHKLEGAHKDFDLIFTDKIIADVGASTGGFTEYALINGASKVYAIDVGHDQLAQKLCDNPKVINLEGTNIKNEVNLSEDCDMAVVDLSFISLRLVAVSIAKLIKENGELIFLVKPQFEVGKEGIGKNGIVKDIQLVDKTLKDLEEYFHTINISVHNTIKSPIKGKSGNQEYLFYCTKREIL